MSFPLCLLAGVLAAPVAPPPSDLTDYVRRADPSFAWKATGKTETPAGTVYDLHLVSQTWHDIKWEHELQVFLPAGVKPTATVVLWNQGGTPNPMSTLLGLTLAGKAKAPVAFLYGVPNQPLFDGKKEDSLIAETFVRYLDTKDPTWPLLLPMVKSVTAAMDAVQAFAAKEWDGHKVTHFVVTGASKRGWTSWLTAATGDPRVKAIAPMVIDFLNFPEQMKNQVRAFGKPSDMIRDYTDRNLVPIPDTPEAKRLWQVVDPYSYREKLALPKLIVNGTNDPYWPLDALNSYWDDLPGEKYLLYVPNAGHGLSEKVDEQGHVSRERVINTLAAFCRCQVYGKPMPKLTWTFGERGEPGDMPAPSIAFESDREFRSVRIWSATAPTRDFRQAVWTATGPRDQIRERGEATTGYPKDGYKAALVEAEYDLDGMAFNLSTQVRILEAKK